MPDGKNTEMPDLVVPMDIDIDSSKYTIEQIKKASEAGFQIEGDADGKKAKIVGRVIVKGNRKSNPLDVSK